MFLSVLYIYLSKLFTFFVFSYSLLSNFILYGIEISKNRRDFWSSVYGYLFSYSSKRKVKSILSYSFKYRLYKSYIGMSNFDLSQLIK